MKPYNELIQTREYWTEVLDNFFLSPKSNKELNINLIVDRILEMKQIVLNLESKQGVSDSSTENGALPLVRRRNASDQTDKSTSESEHGTLGKRTDGERECSRCWGDGKLDIEDDYGSVTCYNCNGKGTVPKAS